MVTCKAKTHSSNNVTSYFLQASEAGILSVVTSINDIFDGTDQKYKDHIVSMNEWVVGLYTELSQSLQVNEVGNIFLTVSYAQESVCSNHTNRCMCLRYGLGNGDIAQCASHGNV